MHYALYSVHCTVYSVHYTLYTIRNIVIILELVFDSITDRKTIRIYYTYPDVCMAHWTWVGCEVGWEVGADGPRCNVCGLMVGCGGCGGGGGVCSSVGLGWGWRCVGIECWSVGVLGMMEVVVVLVVVVVMVVVVLMVVMMDLGHGVMDTVMVVSISECIAVGVCSNRMPGECF